MSNISTVEDLYNFFFKLYHQDKRNERHSLEEYLRALWNVVNKYRFETVTGDLLAKTILEAFETEPAEFNEQWLIYDYAYSGWGKDNSGYLPHRYNNATGQTIVMKPGLSDFELLRNVLLFQIADLHRMKEVRPPKRTISYRSPTGTYWGVLPPYGVLGYILGGVSHMHELTSDGNLEESDWSELAIILQFARLASD